MNDAQLRFDGQVAVVTGAGRGLGRAYARLLAVRGAMVVVNDLGGPSDGSVGGEDPTRSQTVVDEILSEGGQAVANGDDISTEMGSASLINLAIEQFGRVDVVVNNAGTLKTTPFIASSRADIERALQVHVLGTWGVTQQAWQHMVVQQYGRIIITTSAAGLYGNQNPPMAAYSAAKGALYGLTRALAAEGAEHGILVNGLAPRAFTPMSAEHMEDQEQARRLLQLQPPEAVSPAVALLSHAKCPVTGEIIFAGAGTVRRPFMAETQGLHTGLNYTPEYLLEHFPGVLAELNYTVPVPYAAPTGMR